MPAVVKPTPHKFCPQCGQPTVLQMPQCARCGHLYHTPPSAPHPSPIPTQAQQLISTQSRGLPLPWVLVIPLILLLVVASVNMVRLQNENRQARQENRDLRGQVEQLQEKVADLDATMPAQPVQFWGNGTFVGSNTAAFPIDPHLTTDRSRWTRADWQRYNQWAKRNQHLLGDAKRRIGIPAH